MRVQGRRPEALSDDEPQGARRAEIFSDGSFIAGSHRWLRRPKLDEGSAPTAGSLEAGAVGSNHGSNQVPSPTQPRTSRLRRPTAAKSDEAGSSMMFFSCDESAAAAAGTRQAPSDAESPTGLGGGARATEAGASADKYREQPGANA